MHREMFVLQLERLLIDTQIEKLNGMIAQAMELHQEKELLLPLIRPFLTDGTTVACPGLSIWPPANVNQVSIAFDRADVAHGKVNPLGKLLVTANVLFRVNNAGLHSKPAPLIGVSYTF